MNRSILEQAWFLIETLLGYKLAWRGGTLIKVNPAYTSQTCSKCGQVDKASRNGKHFCCTACGHSDDADINAAKNILAAGLAVLDARTSVSADVEVSMQQGRPRKRQPALEALRC